jgi:hypothetical protein
VTQTQGISAVENATLQPVVDPLNPPWINSLSNGHAVLVSTPDQLPICAAVRRSRDISI